MTLLAKAVISFLVVLLFVGVGLRARKLRRDEARQRLASRDQRLVTPPPSPYVPSRGFRLVDELGDVAPMPRSQPARPSLEANRTYVFGDPQLPTVEERTSSTLRHDSRWALERSAHRSPTSGLSARTLIIAVLVVVLIAGAAYAMRSRHAVPNNSLTPTTVSGGSPAATTTPTWPSAFVATAVTGQGVRYSVPAAKYVVTVRASSGAEWVVFRMGTQRTLEYQGRLAPGQSKALQMTGASRITLASPQNATVKVGGSPVTLPTPRPSPLTLIFTPSVTAAG